MAAERSTETPAEIRKRLQEVLDDYYDRCGDRMEAVDDSYLDDIAGGYFSTAKGDEEIKRWTNEDGSEIIYFAGTDTCSRCGNKQFGARFYQISEGKNLTIVCDTCKMIMDMEEEKRKAAETQ